MTDIRKPLDDETLNHVDSETKRRMDAVERAKQAARDQQAPKAPKKTRQKDDQR